MIKWPHTMYFPLKSQEYFCMTTMRFVCKYGVAWPDLMLSGDSPVLEIWATVAYNRTTRNDKRFDNMCLVGKRKPWAPGPPYDTTSGDQVQCGVTKVAENAFEGCYTSWSAMAITTKSNAHNNALVEWRSAVWKEQWSTTENGNRRVLCSRPSML